MDPNEERRKQEDERRLEELSPTPPDEIVKDVLISIKTLDADDDFQHVEPENDTDTDSDSDIDDDTILLPEEAYSMPRKFMKLIHSMGGVDDVDRLFYELLIAKKLRNADVDDTRNRLSLPMSMVKNIPMTDIEREDFRTRKYITVKLIEPNASLTDITLSKWRIEKNAPAFVLSDEWNQVLHRNRDRLKKGVCVRLWSFHIDHKLWLALAVGEENEKEEDEANDQSS